MGMEMVGGVICGTSWELEEYGEGKVGANGGSSSLSRALMHLTTLSRVTQAWRDVHGGYGPLPLSLPSLLFHSLSLLQTCLSSKTLSKHRMKCMRVCVCM